MTTSNISFLRWRRRAPTFLQQEGRSGYFFIAPLTILLSVFYLYPLALTIIYSFTNWNPAGSSPLKFVGVSEFVKIAHDPEFIGAARNTGIYVLIVVPVTMALGLVFAALLSRPFHGRNIYRMIIFLPYVAPTVGSALIFTYLLSPLGGLINDLVTALGAQPIGFLDSSPWAFISVVGFSIWHDVGFSMVIYSAALTNIPVSYQEAAQLDGAGPVRRFISISIPLVLPTTGFLAVTGVIRALQVFTQVYVLTGGGPLHSSETILYYIYEQGFIFFQGGSASAAAVVMLVVGVAATVVQLRVFGRNEPVDLA